MSSFEIDNKVRAIKSVGFIRESDIGTIESIYQGHSSGEPVYMIRWAPERPSYGLFAHEMVLANKPIPVQPTLSELCSIQIYED